MSDANVFPLSGTPDAGGVRQARFRRGQSKPRKPRKPALRNETPQTPEIAENTSAIKSENSNNINDVVTLSERLPNYESHSAARTEFQPTGTVYATVVPRESLSGLDVITILAAISLTAVTATLSVSGMTTLFPGITFGAMWLGGSIEACKLAAAAWLGHRFSCIGWGARLALGTLVAGAMALNAVGVYGQLVAGHVGPKGEAAAGLETRDAEAAAKIEVATGKLADIDRRLAQIDGAVEAATKRGRTNGAMRLAEDQRRARAALAGEREKAAQELAAAKTQRAGDAAKGHAVANETLSIQYIAELFGINRGGEEVARWFIAGLVACGDPFAIILLAVVMGRRREGGKA